MKYLVFTLSMWFSFATIAQDNSQIEKEVQIKMATHFLTQEEQGDARILGHDETGEIITLRESDSHLTCLIAPPENNNVEIACYYSILDDFMRRGRELRAEGMSAGDVHETRRKEIEAGKYDFPDRNSSSMLYVMNGKVDQIDAKTGKIEGASLRYVIYVPYATQESTGMPLSPARKGMPWLMDPGTYRAHIMITPAK